MRNNIKYLVLSLLMISNCGFAQKKQPISKKQAVATTKYQTVKIGDLEWMTTNLNVSKFRNGDPIPEAKSKTEWKKAAAEGKPAWCYVKIGYSQIKIFGDPATGKFGKLYNWYAVNDPRGLAPKGWHIATVDEWYDTFQVLGAEGQNYWSYKDVQISIRSQKGWFGKFYKEGYGMVEEQFNGTNSSGLNILAGGEIDYNMSIGFYKVGEGTGFWTPTWGFTIGNVSNSNNPIGIKPKRYIDENGEKYFDGINHNEKGYGLYVRCVKGNELDKAAAIEYVESGELNFKKGDYAKALIDFKKALEFNPKLPNCNYYMGLSKFRLDNNYSDYIETLKKSIQIIEQNENNTESKAFYYHELGIIEWNSGDKESGCLHLYNALELGRQQAQEDINNNCN